MNRRHLEAAAAMWRRRLERDPGDTRAAICLKATLDDLARLDGYGLPPAYRILPPVDVAELRGAIDANTQDALAIVARACEREGIHNDTGQAESGTSESEGREHGAEGQAAQASGPSPGRESPDL